jgi:hypothetical protein
MNHLAVDASRPALCADASGRLEPSVMGTPRTGQVEREAYELFLVRPTGRGPDRLGRSGPPATWDAPAWTHAGELVELPYYFRNHFVSALEDFELPVHRLRGTPADAIRGTAPPAWRRPGSNAAYAASRYRCTIRASLRGTNRATDRTPAPIWR